MNEEQLKLRASLGLASTATDAEVLAAQTKQSAELTALRASAKTPDAVITAAVAPVQAQVAELEKQLKAEKDKGLARDVQALVAKAERGDGKTGRSFNGDGGKLLVATAGKIAQSEGLEAAEKFLQALPLTPGLSVTAIGADTKPDDNKLTASAATKELDALVAAKVKAGMSFKDATRAAGIERKDLADVAYAFNPNHAATAEN